MFWRFFFFKTFSELEKIGPILCKFQCISFSLSAAADGSKYVQCSNVVIGNKTTVFIFRLPLMQIHLLAF